MNIDFLKGLLNNKERTLKNNEMEKFQVELSNKLEKMEEKFTIDRFEGNVAVCENRTTGEFIEIEKEKLPNNIKEGTIIKKLNDNYIIDEKETEEVSKRIKEKMDRLWNS